jgi:hypothetical protein
MNIKDTNKIFILNILLYSSFIFQDSNQMLSNPLPKGIYLL